MGEALLAKARLFYLLGLVVLLAGCGSAAKRKAVARVPARPPAPQALPFSSSERIRSLPAPFPDAVDLLILRAEALYNAGMSDYNAGNLEKSKTEFDQALATLLESDLDIESDDRLSSEFDKLVESVYGAEVAALERGDTLSPHNYEPAPIESFAELTFPVDPKVKQRAQQEVKSVRSDLPLVSNDYVAGVLTYIQGRGRTVMETVLKRLGTYQPIISEVLRKEGLPQELIYLAAAESAFNPFAISRAGAKGIWQFMLGTSAICGLKKDRWVDERLDPVKATEAAARHLKDLYQSFGDWSLAMAAYDSGPVNVQRAIEKTGYADFWTLRKLHALPRETENYVPIFLATAMIAKDPHAYGFDVRPDPPFASDQVVVGVPTDLRLVAQLIDRPVEDLIKLNPSLLRWTTPANDPQFVLRLPPGTREAFERNVAFIPPQKRIWWRTHKVGGGETLTSIARKFHLSPVALAQANQMAARTPLEEGARLVLPMAPGRESSLARVKERGPLRLLYYRVRPGDTLELVADRFDVTPYQIRRWNHLQTSQLVAGKSLRLYAPSGTRSGARRAGARRRVSTPRTLTAKQKANPPNSASAQKAPESSQPVAPAATLPTH